MSETASLAAALAELQAKLPDVKKSQTATVISERTGKSYSYKYAGMASVAKELMSLLASVGLSFTSRPTLVHGERGSRFVLAYSLLHVTGQSLDGEYPLPDPDQKTPQAVGSAITYARRYVLTAITGMVAEEDDDGHAAAAAADNARQQRTRRQEHDESAEQAPTPEQAENHAALVKTIQSASSQTALRLTFDMVKTAFKADELTVNQANGLRNLIGQLIEKKVAPIGDKTRARLFVLFGELDYAGDANRQNRRDVASKVLGRTVESMKTLGEEEAQQVIAALEKRKAEVKT